MAELDGIAQYVVNGYQFDSRADYEAALQEKKGILYLNEQTDLANTSKVLELYNELIEKRIFSTPVGMDYLKQLRSTLLKNKEIDKKELPYVYVPTGNKKEKAKAEKYIKTKYEQESQKLKKSILKQKESKRTWIIMSFVLFILVIVMFVITLTSKNPTIINYEQKIQDKYAGWAEDLSEKESELNSREATINNSQN